MPAWKPPTPRRPGTDTVSPGTRDGGDDGEDDGWYEDGPAFTDLRDALAWARRRTDAVVVRPAWDENTHYWAGQGIDTRGLPPLDPV